MRNKALSDRLCTFGLPTAPITRPEELFDDIHLQASGGLAPVTVPADGSCAGVPIHTQAALLPLTLDDQRLGIRRPPPALGADANDILASVGYSTAEIQRLVDAGVLGPGAASSELSST